MHDAEVREDISMRDAGHVSRDVLFGTIKFANAAIA